MESKPLERWKRERKGGRELEVTIKGERRAV